MMIALWKPIVSFLLLSATTVLAADKEFILEKDGIVQIICSDGTLPGGVCKFNGEISNFFTNPQGEMSVSYGNGVCSSGTCPTNQPADTITCDEAAVCTCQKCADSVDCEDPQGECDTRDSSGESGGTAWASTLAAGVCVWTVAGAALML